jgi:hypothetical protein
MDEVEVDVAQTQLPQRVAARGLDLRRVVKEWPQLRSDPKFFAIDDAAQKNIGQSSTNLPFVVIIIGTVDMSVAGVLDCMANRFSRASVCWRQEGSETEPGKRLHPPPQPGEEALLSDGKFF